MRKLVLNTYANVFAADGVTVIDSHIVRTQTLVSGANNPEDPAAHMYYEPASKVPQTTFIEVVDVEEHDKAVAMDQPAQAGVV